MRTPTLTPPLALLALLALTAPARAQQSPRPSVPDTSPFRPLELPTPNAYRTASGMPGPSYWQQKGDYDIRAALDTATHTIRGEETIRYTNNSPDTLRYVWIQLDQNTSGPNSRLAMMAPTFMAGPPEPGFEAGYTIERVNVLRAARPGGPAEPSPLTYRVNNTMMRVDLDRPLPPKASLRFDIAWHNQVPRQGRTGRERFPEGWLYEVAQWFPRMAVYDDVRGWNTEQYFGSGEFYLDYGDIDFAITAPAGYTVTGTGVLRNAAELLPAEQRRRLALAVRSDTTIHIIAQGEVGTQALLPPGTGATRTWRFHAENVRDVAWAAAPDFIWDASGWEGILIQALYPPAALPLWAEAADMGRHTIQQHSRWFRYPYPTAINVNGPVGGMEYPMIVFCSERRDRVGLYFVTTHELGHEWYPMVVGSNERLYGWQDEGFNTFIDYFSTVDRFRNDTVALRSQQIGSLPGQMSAWLQFLRTYRGREAPIMEPQDRNDGMISGWLHYRKPAAGLHFLRDEVLDSTAFDQAFREYTRRWAFRHPTPADFFRTMNDALGEDLSWFWRSWFYRSDHLDQAVDSVAQRDSSGTTITRIFLSNKLEMVAPVDIAITGADGSRQRFKLPVEIWMRSWSVPYTLRTPSAQKPVRIEIDPRGVYPDVDRRNNVWSATP